MKVLLLLLLLPLPLFASEKEVTLIEKSPQGVVSLQSSDNIRSFLNPKQIISVCVPAKSRSRLRGVRVEITTTQVHSDGGTLQNQTYYMNCRDREEADVVLSIILQAMAD